jgi:hypothetical protein
VYILPSKDLRPMRHIMCMVSYGCSLYHPIM